MLACDLYRDDGLAVINTISGRLLADKARKVLICIVDSLGLKITAHANQTTTQSILTAYLATPPFYTRQ